MVAAAAAETAAMQQHNSSTSQISGMGLAGLGPSPPLGCSASRATTGLGGGVHLKIWGGSFMLTL